MVRIFLVLIICLLFVPQTGVAGPLSKGVSEQNPKDTEIKVIDSEDKLIQKRQKEARKLIEEGRELIKKGEKKNKKELITKGQIKKEIGEKQLELLQEQVKKKKTEDENYDW